MNVKATLFLLIYLFISVALSQETNEFKFALVIGVQNYSSVTPLRHAKNDANDLTASLKAKGFKVETLLDPKTKKDLKDAIVRYYTTMKDRKGAIGVIYYAGHGLQYEGENYLIPTNVALQIPSDLDDQCVKMNSVVSVLNSSNNNLNILLLDACRSNSFPSFERDLAKGLRPIEAPTGSIVVFATQPGNTASDGLGKNGLFTSKLLKYIDVPGLNIGDVLKKVKHDVHADSDGKQLPSVLDNSIGGDFFFTKMESTDNLITVAAEPAKAETVTSTVEKKTDSKTEKAVLKNPVQNEVVVNGSKIKIENQNLDRRNQSTLNQKKSDLPQSKPELVIPIVDKNDGKTKKPVQNEVAVDTKNKEIDGQIVNKNNNVASGNQTRVDQKKSDLPQSKTESVIAVAEKKDSKTEKTVLKTPIQEEVAFDKSLDFGYGYGSKNAPIVKIGSQVWLGKNLNVSTFANGDPIPEAKTEDEWRKAYKYDLPAWSYYNADPANGKIYGKLYNWHAIKDPRGLIPKGWHLPSDEEWTYLMSLFGGYENAGYSLKSNSFWAANGNGNNKSGLALLPGGKISSVGFEGITKRGYYWSSTEPSRRTVSFRFFGYASGLVGRDVDDKFSAFSIRCLKDQ